MQNFSSQSSKTDKNTSSFTLVRACSDFIPVACHLNEKHVINSNGTIQTTIVIHGFNPQIDYSATITQRDFIRDAITKHLGSPSLAIWVHTKRSTRDLSPVLAYPSRIAAEISHAWNNKNYWHDKYVNDIYVTIVHKGVSDAYTAKNLAKSLNPSNLFNSYTKELHQACTELSGYSKALLEELAPFAPVELTIRKNELGHCSDYSKFINQVLHFSDHDEPLPIVDLAKYATDNFRIAFGNKALQLSTQRGKLFAAMLSFKEYHDIPLSYFTKLLSLPEQFTFTEIITFEKTLTRNSSYAEQEALLKISGDPLLKSHLKTHPLADKEGKVTAKHQLSLMVTSPTLLELDLFVQRCVDELSKLGLLLVREDLAMEEAYWAQLPGNFRFIKRSTPVEFSNIGGFLNLHHYQIGRPGSEWGEFITLFRTLEGGPYRFNFHVEDNGNTIIIGPKGCGTTVMHKFLLVSATKFSPTIHAFQLRPPQALLTMALDGEICQFSKSAGGNSILQLIKQLTPELAEICWLMVTEIINHYHQLDIAQEEIAKLAKQLATTSKPEADKNPESIYNRITSSALYKEVESIQLEFHPDKPFYSYLYEQLAETRSEALAAVTHILMGHIISKHNKNRFIISIDCLQPVLGNLLFARKLEFWLEEVRKAGGIMLVSTNDLSELAATERTSLLSKFATKVLMAGSDSLPGLQRALQMDNERWEEIKEMKPLNRHIAFLQDHATFAELNLTGLNLSLATLSEKEEDWKLATKLMQDYGLDAIKWVPYFYQQIK